MNSVNLRFVYNRMEKYFFFTFIVKGQKKIRAQPRLLKYGQQGANDRGKLVINQKYKIS